MAATESSRQWESDVVLADGGTVHVRPILPSDADALVAFHGRLSPESIYFRFFSPKPRLTEKEVEKFTTVDMVDRVALVAELGDELIAVARYDRWPGRDEAEVAFTVDDEHHGRGIATLLLEHLAAIGRRNGLHRFTAEVLPDNRPMLGVFRRAGFEVHNEFSGGVIDVAFDIEPTLAYVESVDRREQRAESRSIARLMRPRSVAVIGASDRPGSVGREVFRNLLNSGFHGPVYPVNPTAPHVASVPAYDSVLDIPDDIHLAVVAVPAEAVPGVIGECAQKRVRGAIIVSTGFADAGPEGAVTQREIVELARLNGMRIIGPASLGVINTDPSAPLHASFAPTNVSPGHLAVSLQSGPLGAGMIELAKRLGVGLSSFVSLGNKSDVSANDLLNYWYDDPATDVVLLYTETFGNPRKFGRVARRVSRRKPVVAVKGGRGSPDDAAADALYQQAGVIRVDTVRDLFDVGRVLAGQPLPAGNRVAVVTNALSPAVLALDGLRANGLRVAELSVDTKTELSHQLADDVLLDNPIDLTFRSVPADYRSALEVVLHDPGVDAILAVYAPPLVTVRHDVAGTLALVNDGASKPIVAVLLGHDDGPLLPGSAVPAFAFPESATAALGRVARYAAWRARPEGVVPDLDRIDSEAARTIVAHAMEVRPAGTLLPIRVAEDLLATYGISIAPARGVTTLEAALATAEELGYPVALKAAGLVRLARSESGGVALDIQSPEQLRGSYERMAAALGPAMAEAIVQPMVPGGVETCIALEAHPSFGPVLSFGLGGAFADMIADRPARSLPLTDLDAAELVSSSRAFEALEALGVDVAVVEDLLLRLGLLADHVPELERARLNPILVSPDAAWVLQADVHLAPAPTGPYDPVRALT
jgi:acyl-CoA synthetase (NDP forming)/RimJ/RimL family protein N-acetyltransferase